MNGTVPMGAFRLSTKALKHALLLQGARFGPLVHWITGSAVRKGDWRKRAIAVAITLLILLIGEAMGPHSVHHLFDANHGQVCLLSAQASHFPAVAAAGPSVALAHAMEAWNPAPPAPCPQVHFVVSGRPRAPPSAIS